MKQNVNMNVIDIEDEPQPETLTLISISRTGKDFKLFLSSDISPYEAYALLEFAMDYVRQERYPQVKDL